MRMHRQCVCLTSVLLLLASSNAAAETKATASVGVEGGYASNPYNSVGRSASSATINGTFTPNIVISSPTGSVRLGGMVRHTEYAQRYDGTTDYNVSGSAGYSISELTSISGGANYSSRVRSSLYPVRGSDIVSPDDPAGPDDPVIDDPSGTTNFQRRTNSLSGNLGLNTTLSPFDTVGISALGSKVSISDPTSLSRGYSTYGGGLTYNRLVAANTSIGLSLNVTKSEYENEGAGGSRQIAPSFVLSTKLTPRLSLRATAGVTFSKTDFLFGSRNSSAFSGSINLCNVGDRSSLCMNASRSVSPSSVLGTSTVTLAGLTYTYRLDERSQIGANVSYTDASSLAGLGGGLGGFRSQYGRANVNYSRKLLERLSGVISAIYSNPLNSTVARSAAISGTVGIRYSLGEL